jgi:hypothetical protein
MVFSNTSTLSGTTVLAKNALTINAGIRLKYGIPFDN